MKTLFVATAALALSLSAALAGEVEGIVAKTDPATHMLELEDGSSYVLPEDFDMSLIGEGMKLALAFDEVDGKNVVTDMEQLD